MMKPSVPPQPHPTPDSAAFWKCLTDGRLAIQRCVRCRRWQFPCLERCRRCDGELQFEAVTGRGRVHTFIVQHHAVAPGFDSRRPYVIALVTIDEDESIRVPGRIEAAPGAVSIGARVAARIEPLAGGDLAVAVFRIVSD